VTTNHPSEAEVDYATRLANMIVKIAKERFDTDPVVSFKVCVECSIHIHKNVTRLYETHQSAGTSLDAKVDPLKIIANIAFWIRKLKPISGAFRTEPGQGDVEIVDINEKLSLYLAEALVTNAAYRGLLDDMKRNKDVSSRLFANSIVEIFRNFDDVISTSDEPTNTIRERMIYDMRFRTYGPHHFSHVLTQVVMSAGTR
jgi:hypothetical protein